MTTLTSDQIDKMSKAELHKAAKARSIKYGKLSLMQIREALKAAPELPIGTQVPSVTAKLTAKSKGEKVVKAKSKAESGPREGSKMEKCVDLYKSNKSGSRAELLKLFQTKGGLTVAGSSTYLGVIKKKYA